MSFSLSQVFSTLPVSCSDSASESMNLHPEWDHFIQSKAIDSTQIGLESYRDYEFDLLEEFSHQQSIRYRPYIEVMDRHEGCRPYRENRITLLDGTEMSASLVPLKGYHDFIATQAPFKANRHLFWQMVVEKQIDQIVMLTELFETRHPERELAYPYWSEKIGEKLILENNLEVTLLEQTDFLSELEHYIQIRKFNLRCQGRDKIITHYWYRNWMDDTAPTQTQTILTLMERVEGDKKLLDSNSPLLVHCSGGIGRAGVFLTLYHLMQREKNKDQKMDLFHFVAYLRWHRPYLIAQLSQYKFCYQVHAILQETIDTL